MDAHKRRMCLHLHKLVLWTQASMVESGLGCWVCELLSQVHRRPCVCMTGILGYDQVDVIPPEVLVLYFVLFRLLLVWARRETSDIL